MAGVNNHLRMNQAGIDLVRSFEGFFAEPYLCPAGVATIGFGETSFPGFEGQMLRGADGLAKARRALSRVTRDQAEEMLRKRLDEEYGSAVKRTIGDKPMNANQYAALVSLAYNIGTGGFAKSSVCRKFKAGDLDGAKAAFSLWNKAGGKVLRGLVRRRAAEAELFDTLVAGEAIADAHPDPMPQVVDVPKPLAVSKEVVGGSIAAAATVAGSVLDSAASTTASVSSAVTDIADPLKPHLEAFAGSGMVWAKTALTVLAVVAAVGVVANRIIARRRGER